MARLGATRAPPSGKAAGPASSTEMKSARRNFQSGARSRSLLQASSRVPCLLSARSIATSRPILSHSANPRSSVESFGPNFANDERICGLRCPRASVSVGECAEMKPKQKAGFSENSPAVAGAMLKKTNAINFTPLIQTLCPWISGKTIEKKVCTATESRLRSDWPQESAGDLEEKSRATECYCGTPAERRPSK